MEQRRLKAIYNGYQRTLEEELLMQEWREECAAVHARRQMERQVDETETLCERMDDSIDAAVTRYLEGK